MSERDRPGRHRLLSDFPVPTTEAWRAEARRLLRGIDLDAALVTRTLEDVLIGPLATAADTADLPWLEGAPGQAPFLRGSTAAGHRAAPWLVAQELPLPTAAAFNAALTADLARGQNAVRLVLDAAGRRGLDPDRAPADAVCAHGTSIADVEDLGQALASVDLAATPLQLAAGTSGLPLAALVAAHCARAGVATSALRGVVGGDPVAEMATDGALPRSLPRLRDEQAALVRWAAVRAPGMRALPFVEDPWHEGGADGALGLALLLAGAVAALRDLESRGVAPDIAAGHVVFEVSVASDFFLEIARVRALRLLWSRVQEAAGLTPQAAWIHARTSRRAATVHDAYVNMLRATTQAFSAVLGGVQSLHVAPFDAVDSVPDEFGRRIARNVQLLLWHEVGAGRVIDPAGGSWHVERLTADVAAAAWSRFQRIEAEGGIVAGLRAGALQERIAEVVGRRRRRLATGQDVIVGTTRFADPGESPRPARPGAGGEQGRRRAAEVASRRPQSGGSESLPDDLPARLAGDPVGLVDELTAAVAAGATLGDLAAALGDRDTADPSVAPVPVHRDAAPFEDLRRRVAALCAVDPRRATVACACVGNLARSLPRLEFGRRFVQVAGLAVEPGKFHAEAEAAARAALATGAPTVLVVAADDVLAAQGTVLVRALKAASDPPVILLAGKPDGLVEDLRGAGADAFIHAGADLLEVLGELIARLEVPR